GFKGVLLEGLEVWLIVVALGVQTHHTLAAGIAAIAALLRLAVQHAAEIADQLQRHPPAFAAALPIDE
ncbi:MAG TPA: hypothetical protein PK867_13670, partial [Pirellulales bacterium]|nr:hypothetical protein [Pirellulales bacterium]